MAKKSTNVFAYAILAVAAVGVVYLLPRSFDSLAKVVPAVVGSVREGNSGDLVPIG